MTSSISTLRKAKPASWLLMLMLVVFPLSQHVQAGLVLCFGGDGHIQVESAAKDDVMQAVAARSEVHFNFPSLQQAPAQHGPCYDIPLFSSFSDHRLASPSAKLNVDVPPSYQLAARPLLSPASPEPDARVSAPGADDSFSADSAPRSSLAAVVLLI